MAFREASRFRTMRAIEGPTNLKAKICLISAGNFGEKQVTGLEESKFVRSQSKFFTNRNMNHATLTEKGFKECHGHSNC